jgi:hypothetical protein
LKVVFVLVFETFELLRTKVNDIYYINLDYNFLSKLL